jgi:hypothetical protein
VSKSVGIRSLESEILLTIYALPKLLFRSAIIEVLSVWINSKSFSVINLIVFLYALECFLWRIVLTVLSEGVLISFKSHNLIAYVKILFANLLFNLFELYLIIFLCLFENRIFSLFHLYFLLELSFLFID